MRYKKGCGAGKRYLYIRVLPLLFSETHDRITQMPLDIPAFVAAWTALFKHFDAIGYIPSECTVLYPPYSPALPLPQTPAADMPLNPLILELLQLLPYPATVDDSTSFELLPRTRAICYKEEGYLRWARDPEMFYIEDLPRARQDGVIGLLSEREILLTTQLPDGWSLVLDVDACLYICDPLCPEN